MTDLAKTIAPKSDQLNADDLIAGPMTITISGVRGCDEADQPIAVHFEGDNGKPYKPCKSMRRVMVHCWGGDGKAYAGRRLTLYRDENVMFGGIKVGGIRISHMSHIDREMEMALTVTKARRSPYRVKPLRAEVHRAETPARTPAADLDAWDHLAWAQAMRDAADAIDNSDHLQTWWADVANSAEYQRLIAADEGEALALKGHAVKRKKALV
jgi:hypothetical protein